MTQRKIWKQEEDQILKELFEQKGIKKWSQISKIMEQNYGIEGRNGKQCRQRYHNHLKQGINKQKWSNEQEEQLIKLHAIHGNRWAFISKLISGRTQNCVKNMLYSKLRKAVRQLNNFSADHFKKELKQIKINFIYRLIQFTQSAYRVRQQQRNQQQIASIKIKNQILNVNYQQTDISSFQKQQLKQLVNQIHHFKKINQRFRGGHKKCKSKKYSKNQQKIQDLEEDLIQQQHPQCKINLKPLEVSHTKDQLNVGLFQVQNLINNDIGLLQIDIPDLNNNRKKISTLRMDSHSSNISAFLADSGLEQPILCQNYMHNLTPLMNHQPNWKTSSKIWRGDSFD